ncbi:ABC transporter ATP-binding protein [Peptoniphilus rhinitidis]|uniref:ABC transporter ATP-binding protein n=1 Tax=Peptoniphilus rhinitidis TaxID=1175452 RepID=UPI00028A070D|nr:ABC transporter ATP-binding protein [Peptoniphilus rhinitidis]MDU1043111.1 ABC transporter ATP-binding protein [Peptoniphilus rhinitidis]MDU2109725.1 ABC transporter ATP-binding protein [Peptoniphilus lacydonensis]MDU3750429.1 ABC transporter ATP-binding protein [Peptoniphilus rhinitidis]
MRKNKEKISSSENKVAAKKLFSFIFKRHKYKLIAVSIMVIISSLATISISLFMRFLIDDYVMPLLKMDVPDYSNLLAMLIKMAIFLAVGVFSSFMYSRLMVYISEETMGNMRKLMFEKMEALPVSYFDSKSHGDIMSYYTNDVKALGDMIAQSFPSFVSSLMTIIMVLIAMFSQSFLLSLIIILTVGLMIFVMNVIGGKSSHFFLEQQKSLAKTNGYIEEMIDGLKVVKVFNHEENAREDFEVINEELMENTMIANRLGLFLFPIIFGIGNFQYILFALIGGLMAVSGKYGITVGIVASFLQLSRTLTGPMGQIGGNINSVVLAIAGSRRIFEFLEEEPEDYSGSVEKVVKNINGEEKYFWHDIESDEYRELLGDIRFNDVTFSYDGENKVLKNLNLYAKPGQKVAFVGATGAGKTTITNLINRFYEIDSGVITFDGIDIRKIKKDDLRSSLGMVLQDTHLFTGTIAENINYSVNDIDMEKTIEAAKRTNAHDFIKNLKDGYYTVITGAGGELSEGQMQLLSIARAEIYNPPVMILDEATSSIDSRTEKIVQEGMDEIMKGRTTFVIAHRLSTIMNSDVIIVLENGEIIERGDHEDLLEQKGIYYNLYTGGFEE